MKAKTKSKRAKKTKKLTKNKSIKRKSKKSLFSSFRFDKRIFIIIAFSLFITSAIFLILKKDLISEEIIKYGFFSLTAYLIITAKEKVGGN